MGGSVGCHLMMTNVSWLHFDEHMQFFLAGHATVYHIALLRLVTAASKYVL